jgi:hypothetical protein
MRRPAVWKMAVTFRNRLLGGLVFRDRVTTAAAGASTARATAIGAASVIGGLILLRQLMPD